MILSIDICEYVPNRQDQDTTTQVDRQIDICIKTINQSINQSPLPKPTHCHC